MNEYVVREHLNPTKTTSDVVFKRGF
jgi:hypothetical protein